jgi:rhodanese-related sulfurtransferase
MVENGADLVDVREQSEFEAGALPDAINIPLSSMASRLKELDETQIIVVYCLSGGRASQALTLLCDAGYVVYSLGAMANYPN